MVNKLNVVNNIIKNELVFAAQLCPKLFRIYLEIFQLTRNMKFICENGFISPKYINAKSLID